MLAGLLAACGGGGQNNALPPNQPDATSAVQTSPQQLSITPDAVTTATASQISLQGKIAGLTTGRNFILDTGSVSGKVPITTTSSTTINTYRAALKTGVFAIAVGKGSTGSSLAASYVALYPTAPTSLSLSGTVSGLTAFGFDLRTSQYGVVPVMADAKSSGTAVTVGASIKVSGVGSTGVAVLATSISTSSATAASTPDPATPDAVTAVTAATTATTTSMTHVLTGDYLGTPYGTTHVSAATAASSVNWVRTGAANGNAYHAAGLKVQIYMDPNRVQSNDPLYKMSSSGFATTCTSTRVHDTFSGITQYVTHPGSTALIAAYKGLVASFMAQGHVDALFEDNAGPIEDFGVSFTPGMPCSYSDSTWLSGGRALEAAVPVDTVVNGLSAFHDHGVSLTVGLLSNSKTIGGEVEHCFADTANPEQGSWPWTATEDTQLQVTHMGKYFFCEGRNTYAAAGQIASRTYALASFLLTYNPSLSVLWEGYATTSGYHVMPESRLVPTSPVVATPSSVASLKQSGGSYVRVYRVCYLAGRSVGECAVAVNPDYIAHAVSLAGFHHTLHISGSGVMDGGTVTTTGAAPSSTLAAKSAVIALP